jgi:hypothetical protein
MQKNQLSSGLFRAIEAAELTAYSAYSEKSVATNIFFMGYVLNDFEL